MAILWLVVPIVSPGQAGVKMADVLVLTDPWLEILHLACPELAEGFRMTVR